MIDKRQLIKKLQDLAKSTNGWESRENGESPESAHSKADKALLEYIGDKSVDDAFNRIEKWYA